jgi:hypothetical protein
LPHIKDHATPALGKAKERGRTQSKVNHRTCRRIVGISIYNFERYKKKICIIVRLVMRGHNDIRLRVDRILASPQTRYRLLLSVELQTGLAVECVRAASRNTLLVARE